MSRSALIGSLVAAALLSGACRSKPAGCVLATYGPVRFVGPVEDLRALISPPPALDEARRLAVDAFVADAILHDGPRPTESARTYLTSYGTVLGDVRHDVAARPIGPWVRIV